MKHCIKSLLLLFTLLIFTSCGTQNNILYFIDEYEIWDIDTSVQSGKIIDFTFIEELLSDLENEIRSKINAITDDIFGHLKVTDRKVECDIHSGEEPPKITNVYIFDPVQRSSIQSIKVSNEFGGYRVYRDSSDTFQLEGYGGVTFDAELFSSLIVSAGSPLAMEKVAQDMTSAQLTEYGLEEPQASWTITTTEGEEFTVYVGDALTTNDGYYVKYADRDAVYIVSNMIADTILQPAAVLIRSNVPDIDITDILEDNVSQQDIVTNATISLSTLNPISGGFTWNEGTPADPFGNSYTDAVNYTILHGDSHHYHYELYTEYKVDKKYTNLSFTITPYSDFGEDASSYLQIYVNDVLRYTSDIITRKTGQKNVLLDISDANTLKIVVRKGDYGCLMLSDVKLINDLDFTSSLDNDYVSLSALSPLNGGFAWNNDYPSDPFDNIYIDSINYAILHGNSHHYHYELSAEYKVDKKYTKLSFTISPYSDFGEDASSYLQIYVNDVLRYTSDIITRKTGQKNVLLDISDANTLKIVVRKGDYGCLMLSDVKLINDLDFTSSLDDDYVSLSTLSPLNGGFEWNNDYPSDPLKNSYTDSINYTILHGNSHHYHYELSTEYYIDKKYKSLSINISPYADYGNEASTTLKIFVDDNLVYTSPAITRKSNIISVPNIPLVGATYLKIVVDKGDYGCLMLSDAKLIPLS